jgi:hypothetical protein
VDPDSGKCFSHIRLIRRFNTARVVGSIPSLADHA